MAKRTVDINIKLKGLDTIEALENELGKINDELKSIDRNSDAFVTLQEEATAVATELNKIDDAMKPITSQQKLDGFKKLGDGLAGAFQIGGAAMLAFGEQTNEEFEKIVKVVGTVVVAIDGIKKVGEAMSAENIRNVKGIIGGFRNMVTAAKTASVGMKAAMISTGIGAIAVAIGLIIANWDKLSKMFDKSNQNRVKALEEEQTVLDRIVAIEDAKYQRQKSIVDLIKEENKEKGYSLDVYAAEQSLLIDKQFLIDAEIKKTKNQIELDKAKYKEASDADKAELEKAIDVNNVKLKTLEIDNKLLVLQSKSLYAYKASADELEAINNSIEDNKNKQTILNAEGNRTYEIYLNQRDILQKQLSTYDELIKNGLKLSSDELKMVDVLNTQVKAMDIIETKRQKEAKLAMDILLNETAYNQKLFEANQLHQDRYRQLSIELTAIENQSKLLESQSLNIESQLSLYEKYKESKEELANFDQKGLDIFNKQTEEVEFMLVQYQDMIDANKDLITNHEELSKWKQKLANDMAIELTFLQLQSTEAIKKIELENEILNNKAKILQLNIADANKQREITEERLLFNQALLKEYEYNLKNSKNAEERKANLELVINQEKVVNDIIQTINDSTSTTVSLNNELNSVIAEVAVNQATITAEIDKTNAATKETSDNYEKQSRGIEGLKGMLEQYGEEIQATQQLINQTGALISAIYTNIATKRQQELDDYVKNSKDALNEIANKDKSLAKRKEQLIDMLADADGQRYADIMAELKSIDEQETLNAQNKEAITNKQLEMQYLVDMANYNASKANKITGIIDATINTALGVTKALPNVVLAAITGVLGAISIGTIAAQPLPAKPTKPKFADGGVVEGSTHSRGGVAVEVERGETIINSRSSKQYANILSAINDNGRRKFANGSTPNIASSTTDLIDYNLMAFAMIEAMKANPMFVSVTEITSKQNYVKVVENKTSL
jgi:hypothetical protein